MYKLFVVRKLKKTICMNGNFAFVIFKSIGHHTIHWNFLFEFNNEKNFFCSLPNQNIGGNAKLCADFVLSFLCILQFSSSH